MVKKIYTWCGGKPHILILTDELISRLYKLQDIIKQIKLSSNEYLVIRKSIDIYNEPDNGYGEITINSIELLYPYYDSDDDMLGYHKFKSLYDIPEVYATSYFLYHLKEHPDILERETKEAYSIIDKEDIPIINKMLVAEEL